MMEYDATAATHESGSSAQNKRVSWAAILAGAVVVVVTQLLLALLGLGVGAGTIDPLQERNPMSGIGTLAIVWLIISSIIALFAGGWVAGRVAGMPRPMDGVLHGIVTWSIATLFTMLMLGTAVGGVVGGTLGLITRGAALTQNLQNMAPGLAEPYRAEADTPERRARNEQMAREIGDATARSVSRGALVSFFGLLLGGIAAGLGGARGARRDLGISPRRPSTRGGAAPLGGGGSGLETPATSGT